MRGRQPIDRRVLAAALVALAAAPATILLPGPIAAQTVTGTLLEQGTGRPIATGLVTLLGGGSEPVDRAETDSLGRFTLRSPDPGAFYVRAERIGYVTKTDGILELGEGGEISIEFYLIPRPVEVEGVEGTAERTDWIERNQRKYLEWQGFYDRMRQGFSLFITPEDLERRPPLDLQHMLEMIPGWRGGRCSRLSDYAVYIDGLEIGRRTILDDPEPILAVEVHRGLMVPLQYGGSGCVMLIWTKG